MTFETEAVMTAYLEKIKGKFGYDITPLEGGRFNVLFGEWTDKPIELVKRMFGGGTFFCPARDKDALTRHFAQNSKAKTYSFRVIEGRWMMVTFTK